MILIADGGSTKTDWRLVNDQQSISFQTPGLNPFILSQEQIIEILSESGLNEYKKQVSHLYYYGAGLANESAKHILRISFETWLGTNIQLTLNDDLIGAARALFQNRKGIVCILGTGSNSGYYNGTLIEDKIPALGYILGDEGSGAYIGKMLVNALLKRDFSEELTNMLHSNADLSMDKVLENVYRKPFPNRYLASLTHLVKQNIHSRELSSLVTDSFEAFTLKNVMKYSDYQGLEIGFVGSVAYHFSDLLEQVLVTHQIRNPIIVQSPIDELVKYHIQNSPLNFFN
jgi:glucosamine kinase